MTPEAPKTLLDAVRYYTGSPRMNNPAREAAERAAKAQSQIDEQYRDRRMELYYDDEDIVLIRFAEMVLSDPTSLLPDMVWEESVHGCRCDTPYGPYTIRKLDQFYWSFGFDAHGYAPSLEAAKAACDRDRRERVRKLFEVE